MQPIVQPFFDAVTGTVTYVVFQSGNRECAVIDPVLDYDPEAGCTSTTNADKVIEFVHRRELRVQWILETHAHADHLSAAHYLKRELGRQDCDWRAHSHCPGRLQKALQSGI